MSEDRAREAWQEWARAQPIPPDRADQAVAAALQAAGTGAGADVAAAAGRLAGGRPGPGDVELVRRRMSRAQVVIDEVRELAPAGSFTAESLAALLGVFGARWQVLWTALQAPAAPVPAPTAPQPSVPPVAPTAPVAASAASAAPPRPPAGPSLREFFSENSILLVSYVGAFLLLVAAVLYEVYAFVELSGALRLAGVLGIDLVFGAAGWVCLGSRRMRLVGHTYVAIFALLAPLVCVAAYVFLGLRQRGISVEVAVFLAGSALTLLYGVLSLRLRSYAYGYLALAALPVAWLGGIAAIGPGAWHGPAAAALVAAYVLAGPAARRLPGLGERFAGHTAVFVHGSVVLAAAIGVSNAAPLSWAAAATLAVLGAGELLAAQLNRTPGAAHAGLAALTLGWAVAAHELGLGRWQGPAVALLTAACALAGPAGRRAPRLAVQPAPFVHGAAALVVAIGLATADPLSWPAAAALALIGAGELLAAHLNRTTGAAHAGLAALALAWAVGAHALGLGSWQGPAVALLTAAYALAGPAGRRAPRLAVQPAPFVHGAAALAVAIGLATADPLSWPAAATLALIGVGELLAAQLNRTPGAAHAGLASLALAWAVGAHALGLGSWQGPAAAALVGLLALAGPAAGRVQGRELEGHLLFVHGAAILAVAIGLASADPLSWPASATLALLGGGELLAALVDRTAGAAHAGLVSLGLAWAVGAHALGLGGWTATAAVLPVGGYVLLGGAAGRRLPFAAAARHLVHPAAAAAVLLGAGLWSADLAAGHRTIWWLPAALALLAGAYALQRALSGEALALLVSASAASLAVLAASAALDRGYGEAAVELLVLAACWGLGAEAAREQGLRWGLRAGLALQALVPVLFVTLPPGTAAAALLASTALLAATAWRTREPAWLAPAGAVLTVDWYWLGRALLPPAPATATSLALLYSPLPVVLGAAGLGLRATLGRRWALPVYAVAAVPGAWVPLLALAGGDPGLAGRSLIAYSALAYAAEAVESQPPVGSILVGAVGLQLALAGANAAPAWRVVALAGISAVVWAGQFAWPGRRGDWLATHRYLGLGGSAAAALAGFTLPNATGRGAPDALLAALAVLVFAGLLWADGRHHGVAALEHVAVVVASPASFFLARYLGATNPQWYVAAPGLALVVIGLALPHDRRLAPAHRALAPAVTSAGAVLLLGTTAAQAFTDTGWGYTTWLVVEAIATVLAGIGTRSRALVVLGAAAVGVGGIRALFVLVEQGLLFAAFGAAALFLLALGAALAALRDRFRGPLATAWRDWS